jgi:hypothetical protein
MPPVTASQHSVHARTPKTVFYIPRNNFVNVNHLMPELNLFVQRCLPRFFTGIFIFKEFTARRLYKSFGVKGLTDQLKGGSWSRTVIINVLPIGRQISHNISRGIWNFKRCLEICMYLFHHFSTYPYPMFSKTLGRKHWYLVMG